MKLNICLLLLFLSLAYGATSQCFPNRHSTNFFDGWVSCDPAPSPNAQRPSGHFIMYDFGKVYKLGQMQVWNSNDPSTLDWGLRDVVIDYSVDGINWLPAGDYTFSQASGLSTYEGDQGPHLNGVEGRYLLITALNNYGGTCFGLAEIRIEGEEVIISDVEEVEELACVDVTIFPNPFSESLTLTLHPGCSGDLRYIIYDGLGKVVLSQTTNLTNGQNKSVEVGRDLPAGAYNLYLEYGGQSTQRSVVKVSRT